MPIAASNITIRKQFNAAPSLRSLRRGQPLTPKMTRPDVVMTEQRLRDVEGLAHTMLLESVSITPYQLADRAKVNWFNARDVLQGLVRKGYAMALVDGRFGRNVGEGLGQ